MIFVTVGTHEQPFNRLVKCLDELKADGSIQEEVIIQTGYSTYEPQFCIWRKFFSYTEMKKNIESSKIVITHGGPSSFIMPVQVGKIPIVVPRSSQFNEHINDHQISFCKAVKERMGIIIVIEDIVDLKNCILNYDSIIALMSIQLKSNNEKFCQELEHIVNQLIIKDKNNL